MHTAHDAVPQDHSQPQPTHPGRTPHAVGHGLIFLMMGIMMPETCWDRSLIINIEFVASCWFSLFTLCFGQFLSPSSGVFHCTHSNGICNTGFLTACEQDHHRTAVLSWSCSQSVWHIPLLCVQWKTPDDGQRNCPKHVEFYSKNKFEKLVHLVGIIIRIYHDARSPERQIVDGSKLKAQSQDACSSIPRFMKLCLLAHNLSFEEY